MGNDKDVKWGAAAGLCFFAVVLTQDLSSDKFNLVDYFNTNTENAYRVLFLSSLVAGGVGGGGLGAAVRRAKKREASQDGFNQGLVL